MQSQQRFFFYVDLTNDVLRFFHKQHIRQRTATGGAPVQEKAVLFISVNQNSWKFFTFRSADGCFCPAHYSQCETGRVSHSLGNVLTFLIKRKQLA